MGRYSLALTGFGLAGVHDAEGIAEVIVLVGENAQHCHVDGHVADATWSKSGGAALVGAHRVEHGDAVSTDPGSALADACAQQVAKVILVVHGRIGGIDEALDDLDEAIGIVMNGSARSLRRPPARPGIAACASMAWLIGITESRLPKSVARERIASNNIGRAW